jgi:hypothetical protein
MITDPAVLAEILCCDCLWIAHTLAIILRSVFWGASFILGACLVKLLNLASAISAMQQNCCLLRAGVWVWVVCALVPGVDAGKWAKLSNGTKATTLGYRKMISQKYKPQDTCLVKVPRLLPEEMHQCQSHSVATGMDTTQVPMATLIGMCKQGKRQGTDKNRTHSQTKAVRGMDDDAVEIDSDDDVSDTIQTYLKHVKDRYKSGDFAGTQQLWVHPKDAVFGTTGVQARHHYPRVFLFMPEDWKVGRFGNAMKHTCGGSNVEKDGFYFRKV